MTGAPGYYPRAPPPQPLARQPIVLTELALDESTLSDLLPNVKKRAVGVNTCLRRSNIVVGLVTLRRRDALEDPGRRSRSVTTHRQDALRAVRERDLENGAAVGPLTLVDVVDERRGRGLKVGELPAHQFRD